MIVTHLCRYVVGEHREREVRLERPAPVAASPTVPLPVLPVAPPTGLQLVTTVGHYYSVAHGSGGQVYVGTNTGVEIITEDDWSHSVIPRNTTVYGVRVRGDMICTSGSNGLDFYNTKYQRIYSQGASNLSGAELALRGNSVLICDRSKITEYSLDGRKKRRVPYQERQGSPVSIYAMSRSDDVIVIDKQPHVHRLNVTTGRCIWTNKSLSKPAAMKLTECLWLWETGTPEYLSPCWTVTQVSLSV